MSLRSTAWLGAPCWITPWDGRRSYLLPDTVETNIDHQGHEAECGAHNWARGHLVELHRVLGGVPLSLHYRELLARHPADHGAGPGFLPVGAEVTARLCHDTDQVLTVVSRAEYARYGPRGDQWQLTVDGAFPTHEDPRWCGVHKYPPSLPFLAAMVRQHLRSRAKKPA